MYASGYWSSQTESHSQPDLHQQPNYNPELCESSIGKHVCPFILNSSIRNKETDWKSIIEVHFDILLSSEILINALPTLLMCIKHLLNEANICANLL